MSRSRRSMSPSARSRISVASAMAQPPSTRTRPSPSSTTYTLTARNPSLGRGSGTRWMPGPTACAPACSHACRSSIDTTYPRDRDHPQPVGSERWASAPGVCTGTAGRLDAEMSTKLSAPPPPAFEDTTDNAPTAARFSLSATQITASALAATTATVAASYLGVAGTVIGAAVASVLTVVGNAVYSHSLRRTGEKVRDAVPIASRWTPRTPLVEPAPLPRRARSRRHATWHVLAAACLGVFAGILVVVTGVELIAGRPLTDVVHGTSGSGTSLLGDETQQTKSVPTPTTTVTVTPSVVVV